MEPSRVESVVAAQEERDAALLSNVGWARISQFAAELLELGTVKTLMMNAALAVRVWAVVVSRVAVETDTKFFSDPWAHASVQNQ